MASKHDKLPDRLRDNAPTFRFAGADWPMTPKLQALPTDRMRAFVIAWCHLVNQFQSGCRMQAAKLAGYECAPENLKFQGYALLQDERILEAIHEQDVRRLTMLGGKALRAVEGQIDNPMAKGHLKAAEMVMDRAFPLANIVKHQHELSEDKAEIFLKLVEQRIREGRSDKEIRAELESQGDAAAVSAADYYLARARANAIDVVAEEVRAPKKKSAPKLIEASKSEDEDW